MTSPYPPAPRKLERSRDNKVLGGVCAGVAKYLNLDPTLVRVLTVILCLFTGVGVIAYLVLLLVIPEEPMQTWQAPQVQSPVSSAPGQDSVWGAAGAPWEQPQQAAQPAWGQPPVAPQPWSGVAADPVVPEPVVPEPVNPEPVNPEPANPEPASAADPAPETAAAEPVPGETETDADQAEGQPKA